MFAHSSTQPAPSLFNRTLWIIVLALGTTALAVLAFDFIQVKRTISTQDSATPLLKHLAAAIEGLSDDDARLVLRTSIDQLNLLWQSGDGGGSGKIELQAARPGGVVLHTAPSATLLPASGSKQTVRATAFETPHVALTLYVPVVSDGQLLQWLSSELPSTLAIALPLLLVPTGWAVARGLRPIRHLAQDVAQRTEDDLSPVRLDLRYRELVPIVEIINRLLLRARAQIHEQKDFVADAAHELRTPIAVISAQAHALTQANTDLERTQRAASLRVGTARAAHLVDQLLTLARIEAKEAPSPSTPLSSMLQQILADMTPLADDAGIDLALDLDSLPSQACGNEECWRHIVENLVGNAIKYAGRGSTVTVSLMQEAELLKLCISDDGRGMAPDARSKALQRFHRGPVGTGDEGITGAGLGLSIVQKSVERLQGEMALSASNAADGTGLRVDIAVPA